MASLMDVAPRTEGYPHHHHPPSQKSSSYYDDRKLAENLTASMVTPVGSNGSGSSASSKAAIQINQGNRIIEGLYDSIFKAHSNGRASTLVDLLSRYELEVGKIRDQLGAIKLEGREHLMRDILDNLEVWESPEFQNIERAWSGTPGIGERFRKCANHWRKIDRAVRPSPEMALANYVGKGAAADVSDALGFRGRQLTNEREAMESQFANRKGAQPGIVNLNIAGAGAGAHANQKTAQELQSDLKLAQTMEVANTQEQRFRSLLQDLNSTSVDLACQMTQAQNAHTALSNLAENTNRVLSRLEAQNEAAQNIVNEIKSDKGMSRALLAACAALLVCVGIPRLKVLLPFLRQVPIVRGAAKGIEKTIRTSDRTTISENLVRERHAYRMAYELLKELAEMRDDGNLLHKIAFSLLGLGRNVNKRLLVLPPPSDSLCDHERWVDRRRSPHSPPHWEKLDASDPY